jgi:hypothetical protein
MIFTLNHRRPKMSQFETSVESIFLKMPRHLTPIQTSMAAVALQ